jgi:hypothetical protein
MYAQAGLLPLPACQPLPRTLSQHGPSLSLAEELGAFLDQDQTLVGRALSGQHRGGSVIDSSQLRPGVVP